MGWTHFKTLSYLDDPLKRAFYAEFCRVERWSTRTLIEKIQDRLFERSDAGQVKLYLSWLDRHERKPGEGAPVALILCAGKKRETVEYLELDRDNIHVAEYLTELPPRRVLQARFQKALAAAKASVLAVSN